MGLPGNDLSAEPRHSAPEGALVPAASSTSRRWEHRLALGLLAVQQHAMERACHVQGLVWDEPVSMSACLQNHSWTRRSKSFGSCSGRAGDPNVPTTPAA